MKTQARRHGLDAGVANAGIDAQRTTLETEQHIELETNGADQQGLYVRYLTEKCFACTVTNYRETPAARKTVTRQRIAHPTPRIMVAVQGADDGKQNGCATAPDSWIAMPQQIVARGIAQRGQLRAKWID